MRNSSRCPSEKSIKTAGVLVMMQAMAAWSSMTVGMKTALSPKEWIISSQNSCGKLCQHAGTWSCSKTGRSLPLSDSQLSPGPPARIKPALPRHAFFSCWLIIQPSS